MNMNMNSVVLRIHMLHILKFVVMYMYEGPSQHVQHLNHMAGTQGSIGPWLLHKLCSIINITPILSTKVTIDCSHHELHRDIKINFFLMVT